MTKLVAILSAIAFATLTAACNTIEGMGKDMQETGQAIQNAAQKSKGY